MHVNLQTERLNIRPLQQADANFIVKLVNSDGWLRFIGDRNVTTTIDAIAYIKKINSSDYFYYNVLELKTDRTPIGVVTLLKREEEIHPDFGFALLPKYEKQGYAFEAASSYLAVLSKNKKYNRIIAFTHIENLRSIALLNKIGFVYYGQFEKENQILAYYRLEL